MKNLIYVLAIAVSGLVFLNAYSPSWSAKTQIDNQTPAADDLAQLKIINARFIHNFVTNDVPSHDQIIHQSFVLITTKGLWVSRKDYLEAWKTGFDPEIYLYWDYRNEKITIIGSTALVRSVNKYTILNNGKETTAMSQYTDTYVKENGVWKCIQAQLTSVAPENYPGDDTIVKKYVKGKMM